MHHYHIDISHRLLLKSTCRNAQRPEERSGMGFTIMESFMDTLKVRSRPGKGTVVTMRKRIAQRAGRA